MWEKPVTEENMASYGGGEFKNIGITKQVHSTTVRLRSQCKLIFGDIIFCFLPNQVQTHLIHWEF